MPVSQAVLFNEEFQPWSQWPEAFSFLGIHPNHNHLLEALRRENQNLQEEILGCSL